MTDTNQLLEQLTQGTPAEKSRALRALRSEEAPSSWIPSDETLLGLTTGGLLGAAALPFSKGARKLSENLLFKKLAKYKADNPGKFIEAPDLKNAMKHPVSEATLKKFDSDLDALTRDGKKHRWGKAKLLGKTAFDAGKPKTPETMNAINLTTVLPTIGGAGGAAVGAGIGAMNAPDPSNYIDSGKLDEPAFKAMLKVLGDKNSSAEDRSIAQRALEAQGENTRTGMSDLGKALAYGSIGTLIGGAAGKQLGKRAARPGMQDSDLGMLADLTLGKGARKNMDDLKVTGEVTGEGIGDAVGATIGGVIPFIGDTAPPASYMNAVQDAADGDAGAADRLARGYDKTTGTPGLGEGVGGMVGAALGGLGGGALIARKLGGIRKGYDTMQDIVAGIGGRSAKKDVTRMGLGAGFGAAAGTAAGTYAGADYEDPFQ